MFNRLIAVVATILSMGSVTSAQDISITKGDRIARIGGCHDCHTPGFGEANGVLDPAVALIGNPVGYQGPWGTTYAANLRIVAAGFTEDDFVSYLQSFQTMPPMPWFNVHLFDDAELRSLHQYILSLGEPGEPAPSYVPPGQTPTTPYVVFVPVMPGG